MEFYGVRGICLLWFKNYLNQRYQYFSYYNNDSNQELIKCGVPQGSVLGPLLFIIYINDMKFAVNNSKIIHFADDTTIYTTNFDVKNFLNNLEI